MKFYNWIFNFSLTVPIFKSFTRSIIMVIANLIKRMVCKLKFKKKKIIWWIICVGIENNSGISGDDRKRFPFGLIESALNVLK